MKPVVSAAQASQQDAEHEGDLHALMDNAGYAVARAAAKAGAGYGARIALLAGAGNNGGDGYVAARHLARRGALVTLYSLGEPATSEARAAAAAWRRSGGSVQPLDEPAACDFVVDALFGVGFHGKLPAAVDGWSGRDASVIAVDLPSGLDGTTGEAAAGTIPADITVALSHFKLGHLLGDGPDLVGRLDLVDLGMAPARPTLWLCEEADALRPHRSRAAHKWSAGSVAVIGGSAGMAGAPVLAANAALGFGAGAVALFVPDDIAGAIDAAHPQIMTHGVGAGPDLSAADAADVLARLERFDVLVLGPGMGEGGSRLVAAILEKASSPVVLDADGIGVSSVERLQHRGAATVITPHAGEFRRLTGDRANHATAGALAADAGVTVVLKGPATIVAAPRGTPWLVNSGGPELATVGSGDVLAGMIAALIARGLDGATAARSAAYWHGCTGAQLSAAAATVTASVLVDELRRFAF